jgi:hypothetical protein
MRAGAASTPVCSWRFILYSVFTFGLTFAVVQHAISTREAYYAVVVYLVTSKFSLLVLSNCALVVVAQLVLFFQYLFLGRLEPREAEVRGHPPTARAVVKGRFGFPFPPAFVPSTGDVGGA